MTGLSNLRGARARASKMRRMDMENRAKAEHEQDLDTYDSIVENLKSAGGLKSAAAVLTYEGLILMSDGFLERVSQAVQKSFEDNLMPMLEKAVETKMTEAIEGAMAGLAQFARNTTAPIAINKVVEQVMGPQLLNSIMNGTSLPEPEQPVDLEPEPPVSEEPTPEPVTSGYDIQWIQNARKRMDKSLKDHTLEVFQDNPGTNFTAKQVIEAVHQRSGRKPASVSPYLTEFVKKELIVRIDDRGHYTLKL